MNTATGASKSEDEIVRKRQRLIADLADRGDFHEARSLCADLLFDFQPLFARDAGLAASFDAVMARCGASQLRRRFLMALRV